MQWGEELIHSFSTKKFGKRAMSSVCRRLRGILSSSPSSTLKPKAKPNNKGKSLANSTSPSSTESTPIPKPKRSNKEQSLVNNLFKERDLRTLVQKFKESSESNWFRARHAVYFDTVRRLASAKQFSWIEEILEAQKKYKDITEEGFVVRLVSLYGEAGMFDHARKLFEEMPQLSCERTVKSLNALLAACVNSNKFDKVEEIFRELPRKLSINPDVVSYNTVIKASCEMGSLDSALSMVDEMERNGIDPTLITFNTLLDAFYRDGRFSAGENIWALMEKKSIAPCIRSYNARLRGLVFENRMSEAVELIDELGTKGLKTNVFSFNALIKGFRNDGNLQEARRWYRELVKNDCAPNRTTFATLVPFVCEMGDFDLALKLCKEGVRRRCFVDAALLQCVVDGLVKESKIEEARKLLRLMNSNSYSRCELKLPVDK